MSRNTLSDITAVTKKKESERESERKSVRERERERKRIDLLKTSFSFSGASLWNTIPYQIKSNHAIHLPASKHNFINGSETDCYK